MWYLVSVSNSDQKYVLLVGKEYVVGRKDCDILIDDDKAVSRRHAVFNVTHADANIAHPHRLPELHLQDVSKFGTFLNKELMKGKTVLLKDGDEIFFGSQVSAYTVIHQPFVVTSSCLDNDSRKLIRAQLLVLGGHIINEWQKNCSFLFMNSISVTIKVICALISLKSVVLPSYLEQYIKYLRGETPEPDPGKYLPEIAETQLDPATITFGKVVGRQSVFQGMKFIFLTPKQFKKMSLAIELAGGTPVLMEEGCDDNDDKVLVEPNTVVINCSLDDNTQTLSQNGQDWVQHVQAYLKKHKKYMIQDAELGYAVLFCSTEKHCNPDINIADQLFNPMPSQTLEAEVLVANTELSQSRTQMRSKKISGLQVIDETMTPSQVAAGVLSNVKTEVFTGRTPKAKRTRDDTEDVLPYEATSALKKVKKETVSPQKDLFISDMEETSRETEVTQGRKAYSCQVTEPVTPIMIEEIQQHSQKRTRASRSPSPTASGLKLVKNPSNKTSPVEIGNGKEIKKSLSPIYRGRKCDDSSLSSICLKGTADQISRSTFCAVTPPPERSLRKSLRTSPVRTAQTSREKNVFTKSSLEKSPSRSPTRNNSSEHSEPTTNQRKRLESGLSKGFEESVMHRFKMKEESESIKQETEHSIQQLSMLDSCEVPAGYLTTCRPIEQQTRKNMNYLKDEDLPSGCVEVQFTSLVIRRPNPVALQQDGIPDGYIRWKGKLVQNFKKFKKSQHAGAGSLPRIIGGSDLEVYVGEQRKELDDWFKEAVEAESQQNEVDRRARELFDWQPGGSKTKKSR